jgi:hypothetical protein
MQTGKWARVKNTKKEVISGSPGVPATEGQKIFESIE